MMPSPHALARWLLCTVAAAATSSADLFAQAERPPEAVALAIGMQQRGLHEEAARYFGEFLAKNKSGPFVAEAQYRLGVSQVELGRGDAAIVSFTAALKGAGKDFVLRPECRYRLGNQLQAAKKFAAAAAQFEALRGEVGADHYLLAAAAYAEGECRRDAGEDKKAVVAFAAAAAAAKGEQAAYAFPALYQQGFGELRQQRYEAAAIAFAQAAPAAPDDNSRGECWFLCGDAALRIPDLDAAQQAFERAVAKPGDFVDDAWHGMGFVAIRRGDGAAARRCFAHVTDEHPDSPLLASARLEIARAWYRDGEQAKALAMLQKLLASNPGEDLGRQARELQGLCALAGGDAAAAVADLEKALAAASAADRPRLSVAVGEAYANLQQWDKALAAYQQVPEGAPVDLRGDALYGACFALHALGRFAESSERAGQLLKLQPRHRLADEAEFAVAENLFALQRYEEAEKAYVGFGSQQQRSAELRSKAAFKGAWCRYLRGDKKAAAAQFAAVSKQQSPFAEEALAMQALALGEAGDDDAALATADQYLARYPQGAFVDRSQRVAARVLKQRGDLAGARQRLARATAAASKQRDFDAGADRLEQADLALQQGDFAAADQLYAQLTERKDVVGARACTGRAWCAFELGDDAACGKWLGAAEQHPALGDEAAAALDLRIALLHRQQDWKAATAAAQRFVERFPQHPRAAQNRYALGVAQARGGDPKAARKTLADLAKSGGHPRADLVAYELAWACRRDGDEAAALAAFAQVVATSKDVDLAGEARLHLGTAALAKNDLAAARTQLGAVQGRHRGRALYQLAFAEFDGGKQDRKRLQAARDLCAQVAAIEGEELAPEALYLGAESCLSLEDRRGAAERLTALLKQAPQHERAPRARLLLGECAVALGDGDAAVAPLEQFLRDKPDKALAARAQLALGRARLLRGEHDRAEQALGAAIDLDDGPVAAEAQFRIGEARHAHGDRAGAIDAFVKLPILYAQAEWVRRGLLQAGLTYLELGQRDKAARVLEELVAKYPNSEEAAAAQKHLRDG
ncbi:MAG: tetratricopeptide repeat protein [Planctomycetes bacterium]|nr:tetratricopeptide repeat protein [Planctomycetota bacterium]